MSKKLILFNLIFLMCTASMVWELETTKEHQPLLQDGFALSGVDGKLTGPDSNDVRFFELSSDVNDFREQVDAGTKLELLPSSALEKTIADANGSSDASYRLWGRVTKYRDRNFIFPNHFLPLDKAPSQEPQKTQPQASKSAEKPPVKETVPQPAVSEPNDVLTLPPEIMKRLKEGRTISPERFNRRPAVSKSGPVQDSILADRTAFLAKQDNGQPVFVLDALGLNVRPVSLLVLPCEALELAEQKQSAVPVPIRFKIAGIITKYKGKNYLLLQKATRIYSHGNFGI